MRNVEAENTFCRNRGPVWQLFFETVLSCPEQKKKETTFDNQKKKARCFHIISFSCYHLFSKGCFKK